MKFRNSLVVSATALGRETRTSPNRVRRIAQELTESGDICVVTTPTGRQFLTPVDGERLFKALVAK